MDIQKTTNTNRTVPSATVNVPERESLFRRIFFSIYSYTIIFCLFGIFSVSYHSCFMGSLSTLEKRYQFSSSTGAVIMITDNIATLMTTLFIGYYGKTAHKPRWMSIGCGITGLSVLSTALPYFIYGPAQQDDLERAKNITLSTRTGAQTCQYSPEIEDCSEHGSAKTMTMVAVTIFALSNFFRGFGTSIYFTYGTPYLDDNVSNHKMPAFFAFIFSMRIFGAPLGFYLTSFCLKYYENPFVVPEGITEKDASWIGAWWIGYIISGTALLLLAIPLSLFPREFRKGSPNEVTQSEESLATLEEAQRTETSYTFSVRGKASQDDPKKTAAKVDMSLKKLPREMYQIATNPLIACQMAGNLFRGIGILGHFVFQTKYFESQFKATASKATEISGTTGFLSKILGVQLGGLLITFIKPGPRILTTCIFLLEATSVFSMMYGATVKGPDPIMMGTYMTSSGLLELNNDCNKECRCGVKNYQPVCDFSEGTEYFSPCHAGCRESSDNDTKFMECKCLFDKMGGRTIDIRTVKKCPSDTNNIIKYATVIAIGGMVSGTARPGNMVTFFRSMRPDQKSLAVAMTGFWHSLFVSIPYPLIYGRIFDDSCLVWSKTCDKRGNCWLYDANRLRITFHTVSIVLIAIGSVFDLIMIFLSSRLSNLYGDSSKGKKNKRPKSSSRKVLSVKNQDRQEVDELFPSSKMVKSISTVVNGSVLAGTNSKKNRDTSNRLEHVESSL